MNIQTKEPIEIRLEDSDYGDSQIDIFVTFEKKEYHYATIRHLETSELNSEYLREWIENTYYDLDFFLFDASLSESSLLDHMHLTLRNRFRKLHV